MELDVLLALRAGDLPRYEEYLELMATQASALPPTGNALAAERTEYTRLNLHRSRRIGRTWRPTAGLGALLRVRRERRTRILLTEPWCADSAQCLPCVALMTACAPDVAIRVLLRDANPAVRDRFLTDGKRNVDAEFHTLLARQGGTP